MRSKALTLRELFDWTPKGFCRTPLKASDRVQKLILCHDLGGGYKLDAEDQGIFGTGTTDYRSRMLLLVDTFIYFSHYTITVPPLNWIHVCHLNGTSCFGTLIVEWSSSNLLQLIYGPAFNPLLPSTQMNFDPFYADKLVAVCKHLNFEGWLVNIECAISSATVKVLLSFLAYFREKLNENGKKLIWYDAVTIDGYLRWQNRLNSLNAPFLNLSDGIFINYGWSLERLESSLAMVKALNRNPSELYFGTDVFGRGTFGGGGFNAHKALRETDKVGASTALFAPGWTFEFLGQDHFNLHETKLWLDGHSTAFVWPDNQPTDVSTYPDLEDQGSVVDYFQPRLICSPFCTNFCTGLGSEFFIEGKLIHSTPWNHLGLQQVLPITHPSRAVIESNKNDAYFGNSYLTVHQSCRLFGCDLFSREETLYVSIVSKGNISFQLNLTIDGVFKAHNVKPSKDWKMSVFDISPGQVLQEIGISMNSSEMENGIIKLGEIKASFAKPALEIPIVMKSGDFLEKIDWTDHGCIGLVFDSKDSQRLIGASVNGTFYLGKTDSMYIYPITVLVFDCFWMPKSKIVFNQRQ